MADELTPESFAQTIKAKYPQYANVPDLELTKKILEKYPAYREKFRQSTMLAGQKDVLASEMEKANPGSQITRNPQTGEMNMTQPGTAASRAREAAIGVLEPLSGQALLQTFLQGGRAFMDMVTGRGTGKAQELVKGAITAPIEPVKELVEGVRTGNYETAAHGAGGFASQTAPAIEGGVSGVKKLAVAAGVPDLVRRTSQTLTSSGPFKTTEPIVANYNEAVADTAARQAESDAAIAEKNTQAYEKDRVKNEEGLSDFEKAEAQKRVGFKEKAAETIQSNREALQAESRNLAVNRSIEEGSKRLGKSVKDLDLKLAEEDNSHYAPIEEAVAKDPGIDTAQIADAAKQLHRQYLEGSTKKPVGFSELMKEKPPEEGPLAPGLPGEGAPPAYPDQNENIALKLMQEQGLLGDTATGTMNYQRLKRISSELGAKLSDHNLPRAEYKAVSALKDVIDSAKQEIADRNGVGADLTKANAFHRSYMELFHDPESSIAKVGDSFGTKNPAEAANEFFRNKGDEIAVGRLKTLNSVYAKDANAVADLAQNLGAAREEASTYKAQRQQQMPRTPKPGERPQPTVTSTTPNKVLEGPAPPTAENIIAEKKQRIDAKGHSIAEISKYDAGTAAAIPAGILLGHPVAGFLPLAAKYGLSFLMTRPSIIDWIARPTMSDMLALEKLPEPVKVQVRQGLQQILDEQSAKGQQLQAAQPVRNFLNRTAIVSGTAGAAGGAGIKNRRDAMEALGQPTP